MSITFSYLSGNTYSTDLEDLPLKFILKRDDLALDISESFKLSNVIIPEKRTNPVVFIPGRTDHAITTQQDLPIECSFDLNLMSYAKIDTENAIYQIRKFWNDSPLRLVDLYWLYSENLDGSGLNYYSYLSECSLLQLRPIRRYSQESDFVSIISLDIASTATVSTRLFPQDGTTPTNIIYGTKAHFAETNNGSEVLVVKRQSDNQGLLVLEDTGKLRTLGDIITNDSTLGTYS